MTIEPQRLLTPQEAALIARCSLKTVRRAYALGALTAYRRRGSRAVLLDPADVLDWAAGEAVEPRGRTCSTAAEKDPVTTSRIEISKRGGSPLRVDLSRDALGFRRDDAH